MADLELTGPQKSLVSLGGSMFVEACPGAGKTKAIVARFVRRTAEERRKGIGLISFTNTAIDEVTDRCRTQQERLHAPHFVGTLDSFINRFIVTPLYTRDYKRRVRFVDSWASMADSTVRLPKMKGAGLDLEWFDFDHVGRATLNVERVPMKSRGQVKSLLADQGYVLCRRAQQRRTSLIQAGVISSSASRALAGQWLADPRNRTRIGRLLAQRFSEVIVDEAQDCGGEELTVLGLLREFGVDLVMVADLDQSIYEFRRALPEKVLEFAATLPQGERLDGNFRSSPAICRITASVRGRQRVDQALGPHHELDVPVRLVPFVDPGELSTQVSSVATDYGLAPTDIAILAYRGRDAQEAAGGRAKPEIGENRVLRIAAAGQVLSDPRSEGRARLRAREDLERTLLALVKQPVGATGVDAACEKLGITTAWLTDVAVRMALTLNSDTRDAGDYTKRLRSFLDELVWPNSRPIDYGRLQTPPAAKWSELTGGIASGELRWSTIHGAKGRQVPAVGLVIPKTLLQDKEGLTALDHWEQRTGSEAKRVLYVGVSRAEQLLMLLVHKDHSDRVEKILVRDEVPYM